jgi:hypothetical protein
MLAQPALAQPSVDAEARAEYDTGAEAYEAKDFRRAAALFTHADELAPNPLVLKLALAAATQADDPLLGMTLVLRAEARAVDGSLAEVARHARSRFASRVGMVRVVCASRGKCHATVGSRRAADGELVVVPPGEVDAVFEDGARSTRVHATVAARAIVDVVEPPHVEPASPIAPPPSTARAEDTKPAPGTGEQRRWSLPPGFFWGGVILSGALGGATVASGVDTLAQHDTFTGNRTPGSRDRGVAAETRTNVLLVCGIASAVATGVIGLFFTRWRGDGSFKVVARSSATIRF